MNTSACKVPLLLVVAALVAGGCASNRDGRVTNPRQPGPAIGNAVGTVGGAVAGNVAGAAVGVGEGFANASSQSFKNDRRVIRTWRTETTADGRTIRVPVEIEVDEYGRPINPGLAGTGTAASNSGSDTGASEQRGPR